MVAMIAFLKITFKWLIKWDAIQIPDVKQGTQITQMNDSPGIHSHVIRWSDDVWWLCNIQSQGWKKKQLSCLTSASIASTIVRHLVQWGNNKDTKINIGFCQPWRMRLPQANMCLHTWTTSSTSLWTYGSLLWPVFYYIVFLQLFGISSPLLLIFKIEIGDLYSFTWSLRPVLSFGFYSKRAAESWTEQIVLTKPAQHLQQPELLLVITMRYLAAKDQDISPRGWWRT